MGSSLTKRRQEKEERDGYLRRLANDLTSIEVDTIIKPNMTARKMPPLPLAMLDLAETYLKFLRKYEHLLPEKCPSLRQNGGSESVEDLLVKNEIADPKGIQLTGEPRVWEVICRAAENLKGKDWDESGQSGPTCADSVVLIRVAYYSRLLWRFVNEQQCDDDSSRWWESNRDELYENYPKLRKLTIAMPPDDVVLVRKACDIGIEQIAMQSIIHLDGDVVNRIQIGFEHENAKCLREMHIEACKTGIKTWKSLMELVSSFVTNMLDGFLKLILGQRLG